MIISYQAEGKALFFYGSVCRRKIKENFMYGRGSINTLVSGSVTTGSGIAILPYTAGNSMGVILAYTAITIGVVIIISQITVRVIRKIYQQ